MRLLGILPCFIFGCAAPFVPPGDVNAIGDLGDIASIQDLTGGHADLASGAHDLNDMGKIVDLSQAGCSQASIVINEVQTDGLTASDDWVELYNTCNDPVDMTGMGLVYRSATGTTDTTITALSGNIGANGFILVANGGYHGLATADFAFQAAGGLAQMAGQVGLKNTSGTVDGVGWGLSAGAYVEGSPATAPATLHSIGRSPDGHDTQSNAADFQSFSTPTPRSSNL